MPPYRSGLKKRKRLISRKDLIAKKKPRTSWRTAAGAASGATLGYIAGNFPGAVAGAGVGAYLARPRYRKKRTKYTRKPRIISQDMVTIKFTIGKPKKLPKRFDRSSVIKYTETFASQYESNVGQQGVVTSKMHAVTSAFRATSNPSENSATVSNQNFFDINPNKQTTGGGSIPVHNPDNINATTNDEVHISKVHHRLSVTSLSNVAATIIMLLCMCKKDTALSPNDAWVEGNRSKQGGQAGVAQQPTTGAGTFVAGYPDYDQYGQDPRTDETFKTYYKVIHAREFVLSAGNTVYFDFVRHLNKTVKDSVMSSKSASGYCGGLTYCPMFITRAAPVLAYRTVETASSARMNYASYRVGFMHTDTTYVYSSNPVNRPISRFIGANLTGPRADYSQFFVDSDDDVAKAVVQA